MDILSARILTELPFVKAVIVLVIGTTKVLSVVVN